MSAEPAISAASFNDPVNDGNQKTDAAQPATEKKKRSYKRTKSKANKKSLASPQQMMGVVIPFTEGIGVMLEEKAAVQENTVEENIPEPLLEVVPVDEIIIDVSEAKNDGPRTWKRPEPTWDYVDRSREFKPYVAKTTNTPVKAHPFDVYRLLGEMVIRDFDSVKIIKLSWAEQLKRYLFPPKSYVQMSHMGAKELQHESIKRSHAAPVPTHQINVDMLPYTMLYEDDVVRTLRGSPYADTEEKGNALLCNVLTTVMSHHYESFVKGDPNKPYSRFDYRANGDCITGSHSQALLEMIQANGVMIGYMDQGKNKNLVPRFLDPEIKSMNAKDAFFIGVGAIYYKDRIQEKLGLPGM